MPPGGCPFHVLGHTICDSVKPASQGFSFANGGRFLRQDKEGRLQRIFGIVQVTERAPTDSQDHRSMPSHERFKRLLVIAAQEGPEQGTVALSAVFLESS